MSYDEGQTLKNYRDEVRNTVFLLEKSSKVYTAQYEKLEKFIGSATLAF